MRPAAAHRDDIDAAGQAQRLAEGVTAAGPEADRHARGESLSADKLRYEMYLVFQRPWSWLYGRTLTHEHA